MIPEDKDIIKRKPVASLPDGGIMEWLLLPTEGGGDEWKPFVFHGDGKVSQPIWMPLPGSQFTFLQCPIQEALYEGTRGPGKTLTLIMDYAKDCGRGLGKSWRGILFRRSFGDLDDIVLKIEQWMYPMFPGFRFLKSKSEYAAVWPDGETLLLRHMRDENDYPEYHGHEYPWIGWEELTQWENDKPFNLMMSCNRPPKPKVPCRIRSTTNPYGAGHNWVKKRYKLPEYRGRVIRIPGEVPRVAVHGSLAENFLLLHAAPNYPDQVQQAAINPAQAEAWMKGDWNVTSGGMIDDIWRDGVHVLPSFPSTVIPTGWTITRAYDHGQSHPFSVGWFLESNGEPLIYAGREYGRIRGDIILWAEWYGRKSPEVENVGLRMSASRIAQGIIDREDDWGIRGRVTPGPADTEIFNKQSDRNGRCPADDMEDVGVYWERADKSAGTRHRGWVRLRDYLEAAIPQPDGTREKPGFFVCDRCRYWLELCPPMPRDTKDLDDVPKTYEDHCADMTRYRINWSVPGMWRRSF